MPQSPVLVWFRNDLRVADNHALHYACENSTGGVIAVAAITPDQWLAQDESKSRVQFWLANLANIQPQLQALNIPLQLIYTPDNSTLPGKVLALAKSHNANALYFNREYPEYEQQRDAAVIAAFGQEGVACYAYDSDVVLPPGSVVNQQEQAYKVFTPFAKTWRYRYTLSAPPVLPIPKKQTPLPIESDVVPESIDYSITHGASWCAKRWPVGKNSASERLQDFAATRASDYAHQRDIPAEPGTSALSPYLTVGAVSVRQCIAALQAHSQSDEWLTNSWLTELIWREFYRHLLVAFPDMNRWAPFRPDVAQRIVWQPDEALFNAWCEGETGFPIVDAGMKQLLETGWMHNRLRMITASFLTKLLRQHWREGAQFFMQHLIDGDFASNLGGWQWSSSVGADAAPYFRIFNPMRQAQRFDPQGDYVAQWLPELETLEGMQRHDSLFTASYGRPQPVIGYTMARQRSLDDYNSAV